MKVSPVCKQVLMRTEKFAKKKSIYLKYKEKLISFFGISIANRIADDFVNNFLIKVKNVVNS